MPFSYKILKDKKLNYIKASGIALGCEIINTTKAMFNDPDWIYVRKQISDFRNIKELVVTFQEFDELIRIEEEFGVEQAKIHDGEIGKLAIVAKNELHDIIFKLYKEKTKKGAHETQIFNTIEGAENWLELNKFNQENDIDKHYNKLNVDRN